MMAINHIDYDHCVGCGICVNSCAYDVIRMDEETGKPIIAYQKDCTACSRCRKDCPVKAISIVPGIHIPITSFFGI